jgi:hypothetical protein
MLANDARGKISVLKLRKVLAAEIRRVEFILATPTEIFFCFS